ncbi:MAG: ComF family protein [Flavonifractor plautii]
MSGPAGVLLDPLFPPKCVFCGRLLSLRGAGLLCPLPAGAASGWQGRRRSRDGEFFTLVRLSMAHRRDQARDLHPALQIQRAAGLTKCASRPLSGPVRPRPSGRAVGSHHLGAPRRPEEEGAGLRPGVPAGQRRGAGAGEVAVETLRKGRNTEAQSGLDDDAARRANVLGAYTAVDAELVEGKRVLLIDDVITTGATISECARILRTVGAGEVVCATLARARG